MEDLEPKIICAKVMLDLGFTLFPQIPNEAPNISEVIKDVDTFETYLQAHPTCSYVVATGKVSGVFAVSVIGEKGMTNLAKMVEANGPLPKTMIIATDQGADLYFAVPDARVPNCEIAEGVAVHGDDSFVSGPDGKTAVLIPDYFPSEVCIPPAENWLLRNITAAAEISRLAQLSEVDYERERDEVAKRLKCRKSVLDKLVQEARNEAKADATNGGISSLREPEPWPEPVKGTGLLEELTKAVLHYVVVAKDVARAIALWIVHTHALEAFNITPRLAIKSPVKGCGKSTLLDVLSCLVPRPLATANITAAAVFRIVAAARPTLLIDEGETFLLKNEELRGILNSGHPAVWHA